MNATIMKGERSKLLAVAILAMFMVVAGSVVAFGDNTDATGDVTADNAVASIGDQYYPTLDLAVQDATDDTSEAPVEIKLLKNASLGVPLTNVTISSESKVTLTLTSAIEVNGTVGLKNVVIATSGDHVMAFYAGNYVGSNPINFTMDNVSFGESVNCNGNPMTVYLDKASTVTIKDSDFTNTKIVYSGNDSAKPDLTITNTKNVDMNISSSDAITIGTDIKIDGTSTIGDVLLAGTVKLTVPAGQTFSANSIGQYSDEDGTSTGSIVTENPNSITTVEPIEVPISNPSTGVVTVTTYDMLVDAIDNGSEKIAVSGTITAEADIKLDTTELNLTNGVLNMGTYALELVNSSVTGGTINGVGMPASNGGDFVVMMKYTSSINGTTISLSAPEGGILPYSAINVDPTASATIKDVTFNATTDVDNYCAVAVQYYSGNGQTAIDGCTLNNGGVIQYNNGTNTAAKLTVSNIPGFTMNLLGTIAADNLVLADSTIAETIIGWDGSMASANLGQNAETKVIINAPISLGTVRIGDDSRNGTQGITANAAVSANGGNLDALTIGENGSFTTDETFTVDLLTLHDASQMPANVIPAKTDIDSPTSERPVPEDLLIVIWKPTYYNGSAQGPFYYIVTPSNVTVTSSNVQWLGGDSLSQTDVGKYSSEVLLSITYQLGGEDPVPTSITLVIDWEIIASEPDVTATDITWVHGQYGDQAPVITYNGSEVLPEGVETSWDILDANGNVIPSADYNSLAVDDYTLRVYYTAAGNYAAGYVDAKATVTEDILDITIGTADPEDKFVISGVEYKNNGYYSNVIVSPSDDETYDYTLVGVVNYLTGNTIYGGAQANGYYLIIDVINNEGEPIPYYFTVNGADRSYGNTADSPSELMMVWFESLSGLESLSITFVEDGYEKLEYTFDVSGLERNTTAGYAADQQAAIEGMIAAGIGADASVSTVSPETMWIAYDNKGLTTVFGELYFGDYVNADEELAIPADAKPVYAPEDSFNATGRWFFAFMGDNVVKDDINVNPLPGVYTIVIKDTEGNVVAYDTAEIVGAYHDVGGFADLAGDAYKGIMAGGQVTVDATDVADMTMWMIWSQYGLGDFEITGNLYYGGQLIWSQSGAPTSDGYRIWYFSFDPENASCIKDAEGQPIAIQLGEYTLEIVASDGEHEYKTTTTVEVTAQRSSVVFAEDDSELIYGKKPMEFMDVTVTMSGETVNVLGSVFLIDSWDEYYANMDTQGYYIALKVTDVTGGDVDWSKAKVTVTNSNNTLLADEDYKKEFVGNFDGFIVLYLGKAVDDAAFKNITIAVDLDGDGSYYNTTTYTIDVDSLMTDIRSYEVTWIDEDYDYRIVERYYDSIIVTGYGPNPDREFRGWNVTEYGEKVWAGGVRVDLSVIDKDGDYKVEFVADYTTGSGSGSLATRYHIDLSFVDGNIVIDTESLNGDRNADAYFGYQVQVIDAENEIAFDAILPSSMDGQTATEEHDLTYNLKEWGYTLASGDIVSITLIVIVGNYTIEYGTTAEFFL